MYHISGLQYKRIALGVLLVGGLLLQPNCIAFLDGNGSKGKSNAWLAFLASDPNANPAPVDVSSRPALELSGGLPAGAFAVAESEVALPKNLPGRFVPVSKVYDVGLSPATVASYSVAESVDTVLLPQGKEANLVYEYDEVKLRQAGFIEEFNAFYYDRRLDRWVGIPSVRVDTENHTVTVITSHFTPFVLTALPIPSGQAVARPPQCIIDEYSANLSGSGAQYMIIDTNFRYYNDRDYIIKSSTGFSDLELSGALGIATCNGGTPSPGLDACGDVNDHKRSTATSYLTFKAPTNLTLYLMYDSRGPVNPSWIASLGFVDTGKTIKTTDTVQTYLVFQKNMATDEVITLPGNRSGLTGPTGIDTNYWLAIRSSPPGSPANPMSLCNLPDADPSVAPVERYTGIAGGDQGTLFWALPEGADIANVIIRRQQNTPALDPTAGEPAVGIEHSPEAYTAEGLDPNSTYYFSIFSLDSNGRYSAPRLIEIATDLDTDGDGIKDAYELNPSNTYGSGAGTLFNSNDSDNDGIDDLTEIIQGTDPRNPDTEAPIFHSVTQTSPATTGYPLLSFVIDATDNTSITAWLVSEDDQRPILADGRWQTTKPDHVDYLNPGNHSFRVWARDAAGNITGTSIGALQVSVQPGDYPHFAYWVTGKYDDFKIYYGHYNLDTLEIQQDGTLSGLYAPHTVLMHPNGRFLYAAYHGMGGLQIGLYYLDSVTGEPDLVSDFVLPGSSGETRKIDIDDSGNRMVVFYGAKDNSACGSSGAVSRACISSLTINQADGTLSLVQTVPVSTYSSSPWGDLSPDGTFITARLGDYGYQEAYKVSGAGALNRVFSNPNGQRTEDYGQIIHPNNQFVYVLGYSQIRVYSVSSSGYLTYTGHSFANNGSGDRAPVIHPNGKYMYAMANEHKLAIYQISDQDGTLSLIHEYPVVDFQAATIQTIGTVALQLVGNDQASFKPAVRTFRFTDDTGSDIYPQYSTVSPEAASVASQYVRNENRPPVLTIRPDFQGAPVYNSDGRVTYPFSWHFDRRMGNANVFFWTSWIDPDGSYCNANTSAYSESTTLSSQPPGSTEAVHALNWASTLSRKYYYLQPKKDGNYIISFQANDDAGTCTGGAKTSIAQSNLFVGQRSATPFEFVESLTPNLSSKPTSDAKWSYEMEWLHPTPGRRRAPKNYTYLKCYYSFTTCDNVCDDPNYDPLSFGKCASRHSVCNLHEATRERIFEPTDFPNCNAMAGSLPADFHNLFRVLFIPLHQNQMERRTLNRGQWIYYQ